MNISEAKQIRIVEYLRIIGHEPVIVRRGQYWYLSPLRNEREPSFKVNDYINEWYDFGISAGGDLIDLGRLLYRTGDLSIVLRRIEENVGGVPVRQLMSRTARPSSIEDEMERLEVTELTHHALLSYLRSRGVSPDIGRKYCREIHYILRKRPYFAIAFENRSGGYEIRNPYYKGCIKVKDISVIRRCGDSPQRDVCLFEGFMDFLSYLTADGCGDRRVCAGIPADFIVMNSVGNLSRCLPELGRYERIHCFLDNDMAGRKTVETISGLYGEKVVDHSYAYGEYKDVNDYLRGKRL